MSNESGMISGLDNMEALVEVKLERADNCINPWCGNQIDSARQIKYPNTEICGICAKLDSHEEER